MSTPERQRKSEGEKQRLYELLASSCLGNPALCLLQGAGVELDPGEGGETEKRGATLTAPQSLETMTDWNHRL